MLRVYTASKLSRGPLWRDICSRHTGIIFHARWLKHILLGTPDTPENAYHFWQQDIEDVLLSSAIIVWAEEGEHLRGALVEAGAAIANNIPVYVVGNHPDYGTWQYHPSVTRCHTVEDAIEAIIEDFSEKEE